MVDGNNAPNGICIMFEGSEEGVQDGIIHDVEALHCQGCFSGYPLTDLYEWGNTCAASVCQSDDPPRGGKTKVNLWTAGDNARDNVMSENIAVWDSYYY